MALRARRGARAVTLVLVSDHGGLRRGLLPRNHQHHLLVVLRKWMVYFMNLMQIHSCIQLFHQISEEPGEDSDECGPHFKCTPAAIKKIKFNLISEASNKILSR